MTSPILAFSDAFASFKAQVLDYVSYSFLANIIAGVLASVMILAIFVFSIFFAGSISNIIATGAYFSIAALISGATLLILLAGFLIVSWAMAGIIGSYLATMSELVSRRKPSMQGFLSSVPRYASRLFILSLLLAILIGGPVFVSAIISSYAGQILGILIILAGCAISLVMGMLLLFALPAAIVDNKGALDSVRTSISLSIRNIVPVLIFSIISAVLAAPFIIPFYMQLFFMPFVASALLIFYRNSR